MSRRRTFYMVKIPHTSGRVQLCSVLLLSAMICFAVSSKLAAGSTVEGENPPSPPLQRGRTDAATEPVLNLSCKGADIRDVLRGIAMQYDVNIVPDGNVVGSVTIHLQNASFEAGLRTLLETNGFEYEKQDDIYLVHIKDSTAESFEISFQDGRLTVDAENADIRLLLQGISKQANLNIVSESGLTGDVTAHLSDVPVEEALYALLVANGFMVDEDNGIYRVRGSGLRQQRGMGGFAIFYRNGKLTIDVKNAPATDVLSEMASQCKINLTSVGNVQGNVTMRLDGVTLEQALDAMMDATGNVYTVVDDIYLVGDPSIRPGQINPLLERKVIWLKHIEAQDLINSLPSDIPRTSVTVSQDRNALILLGSKEIIQQLESLLDEIDVENPDIRSRQQMAISVEVDDEGLLTIDAKDAPLPMLLREISIRKGIDMTVLGDTGMGTLASSRLSSARAQRGRQTSQPPQPPTTSTSAPPRPTRSTASRSSSMLGELVNFRISKATLEETFDTLFKGTTYTYKRAVEGDREFYIIGTGELLPGTGNPLVVTKKILLQYLNASDIIDILPVTIPDANIITIADQNAVVVMGTQNMIDEVENYISQIDSPVPQIMIEALLIEVIRGDTRDLGVSWAWEKKKTMVDIASGLSVAFDSLAYIPENFFAELSALVSENKARVLAKPRVATTNGLQASINVGWTEYFETTTEIYRGADVPVGGYTRRGFNTLESGIILEITPWVGAAGEITVLVHPDIRDAKQVSREHSTIANRSLDTTVRVKDGEPIVIGGLIQRNEATQETKVPVLGSIPVLGNLFKESHKTHNDTELIIVVKPKIIGSNAGDGAPTE